MPLPGLKVNTIKFLEHKGKRYAWYLTVVKIKETFDCFWSQHECTGMSDRQARRSFSREHFKEVEELVRQKISNEKQIHLN